MVWVGQINIIGTIVVKGLAKWEKNCGQLPSFDKILSVQSFMSTGTTIIEQMKNNMDN